MAIATNNNRQALERSLQQHNLLNFFSAIRTTDDGYIKPQPEIAWGIIEKLGMKAKHALMVGDAPCDMLLAQNAGIDAIAVSYGLNSKDKLLTYSPVACIDRIEQLLEFIT